VEELLKNKRDQNFRFMLVPFVDVGTIFDSVGKTSAQHLRIDGGLGLRIARNVAAVASLDFARSGDAQYFYAAQGHQFSPPRVGLPERAQRLRHCPLREEAAHAVRHLERQRGQAVDHGTIGGAHGFQLSQSGDRVDPGFGIRAAEHVPKHLEPPRRKRVSAPNQNEANRLGRTPSRDATSRGSATTSDS
jgi:hypothetical protein